MTKDEALAFLEALENSNEIKNPLGLLESLRTANAEAKSAREELAETKTALEAAEAFKTGSKTNLVIAALKAQGVKNADKVVRLMNLDEVDVNDDASLKGFDEAHEKVRTEWPEILDVKRQAPKVDQFTGENIEARPSAGTALQLQQFHEAHNN